MGCWLKITFVLTFYVKKKYFDEELFHSVLYVSIRYHIRVECWPLQLKCILVIKASTSEIRLCSDSSCMRLLQQQLLQTGESSSAFQNKINPKCYPNVPNLTKWQNRNTRKQSCYCGMKKYFFTNKQWAFSWKYKPYVFYLCWPYGVFLLSPGLVNVSEYLLLRGSDSKAKD